ncbi:hypothetical protein SBA4_4000004 [Candidatus Sulfopaludibacter sp. SbA4]|nr:hypothetical protein SBA4_4000004 [Candidatus Sulfopaludibacter sp. SbA4]
MKGFRQRDSGGFSFIQTGHVRQAGGVVDFKPCGRSGDPAPNWQRRKRVRKFGLHGDRQRDFIEHAGKKLDMADLDQVIDRAGIGDDQPHGLKPDLFESLPFLLEIFESVLLVDAMGLKEAVQLDAGKAEHLTQLYFGDASSPERFEGYAFQRHAREVAATFGQVGGDSVGDLNGHVHEFTLPGFCPSVKHNVL